LVPKAGASCKESSPPNRCTTSNAASSSGSSEALAPASPSLGQCSHCQGFDSPTIWRNANADLHIGDRSFEDWTERRRSEALVKLSGCACVTFGLLSIEISVGLYLRSLALISNGLHLLTDVAMYASLYFAVRESNRDYDRKRFSFGMHRLEVVGVLFALVFQYIMLGQITFTALGRLWYPSEILTNRAGLVICLVSGFSLCVNSALAMWVSKTSNVHSHSHVHGGSTASRMARMHLIVDAVQNGIVIFTGGVLWIDPDLARADTLCTLVFTGLVIASTQGFFRQLLGIVMEKAPDDLDCEKVFKDLESIKEVLGVHCFHAWSISQGKVVVSAHLHIKSGFHEDVLQEASILLKHRYGIQHSTFQVSDDDDLS